MKDIENVRKSIRETGFEFTGIVGAPRSDKNKGEKFRTICATDKCGNYRKSWTCPPAVGPVDDCLDRMHGFDDCIIVMRTFNDVDIENNDQLKAIADEHQNGCRAIKHSFMDEGFKILALTDGACNFCEKCSYPDACIAPEEQMPSVSGFGIDMGEYIPSCGLEFSMKRDSVTFYGLMLFR